MINAGPIYEILDNSGQNYMFQVPSFLIKIPEIDRFITFELNIQLGKTQRHYATMVSIY